ncbi:ankyrin repeat and SOCS box protein 18 [Tachyglossus aculeatus]|uniref:ankyrin repeat and SOCS box protein 18 n=1 Tax=Tachyglossus aculeatus TaxID=9261 RepID=UPI0018F49633|nr:ankyrin repeat and SOCS box protein 18 [Tachyglossus aculeatus]
MDRLLEPAKGKLKISQKMEEGNTLTAWAPADKYYTALVTGDLGQLQALTAKYYEDVNVVFEINKNEMEWQVKSSVTFGLSGLWSLEYKRELTNPLCIAASHGHTDCVRHLLHEHADADATPGGTSALHEACQAGHTDCTQLLLDHQANPSLLSYEGFAPLHLCRSHNTLGCARILVKYGALVDQPSEESQETPLHTAAEHGLPDHVHLYLKNGASVDPKNSHKETPLSVACGQAKKLEDQARYLQVCKLLLLYGADVNSRDEEEKSPLHKASKNANHGLVQLLLRNKADINAIDYNGASPMACVLQSASFKRELKPHQTVQMLLNYGSQKIWPAAFEKVLKLCASTPEVIEILFNSYSQNCVSEKWREAIPKEIFQMHLSFYQSLFMLSCTTRGLQHLCRCAIRKQLGSKCYDLIPLLPVPKSLQSFLLLEPKGIVF